MARMAVPFRDGGPERASPPTATRCCARARTNAVPAGAVLLADHGARRRHLGAERRLPAQRAADAGELRPARGRAGRSGQAALILTYCAAQSPHDQYYFRAPRRHGRRRSCARRRSISPIATWSSRTCTRSGSPSQASSCQADIPDVLDLGPRMPAGQTGRSPSDSPTPELRDRAQCADAPRPRQHRSRADRASSAAGSTRPRRVRARASRSVRRTVFDGLRSLAGALQGARCSS